MKPKGPEEERTNQSMSPRVTVGTPNIVLKIPLTNDLPLNFSNPIRIPSGIDQKEDRIVANPEIARDLKVISIRSLFPDVISHKAFMNPWKISETILIILTCYLVKMVVLPVNHTVYSLLFCI